MVKKAYCQGAGRADLNNRLICWWFPVVHLREVVVDNDAGIFIERLFAFFAPETRYVTSLAGCGALVGVVAQDVDLGICRHQTDQMFGTSGNALAAGGTS